MSGVVVRYEAEHGCPWRVYVDGLCWGGFQDQRAADALADEIEGDSWPVDPDHYDERGREP